MTSYANVTIGAGYNIASGAGVTGVTLTPSGAGYSLYSTSPSTVIPNGGTAYSTWTTTATNPWTSTMNGNITLSPENDIKLGHISLRETITAIQDRLAILVPDPELLEKYEALKQAYDHYKTLEALVSGYKDPDPN